MKKILHSLPALAIAAAALLCLSFDNNSKLTFNDGKNELFQTTSPSGQYKAVLDQCPWGHVLIDCQTGGYLACTPGTCPAQEHETDQEQL